MSWYPNRTLCSVLEEMRKCNETRNYAYLAGLIEEAQSLGNRMEAGLSDKKDLAALREERSRLKQSVAKLRKELEALRKLAGKEDESDD